jgi:hypothetical protein
MVSGIRRRQAKARLALCLSVGMLIGAAPAATADGTAPDYPGSNVHVAVTGSKAAGHLIYIVASGSNKMTSLGTPINYGLYVILVNQKLLPGPCAISMATELNNISADLSAGRQLNFEQYNEGESGPFTIEVPYTPEGAGTLLVCVYSEYVTDDAAWASTTAVIAAKGAPPSGGAAPANTVRPKLSRHGRRLVCTRGSWTGHPSYYSFHWKLAGKASSDTHGTLRLPAKPHGRAVCTVTARNAAGSRSASSRPLALT